MATNHTPTYGLNQWEANDRVVRSEFNEDNQKIEAALDAIKTAPGCVTGTYTGGANSSKLVLDLGFRPSFLVIIPKRGSSGGSLDVTGFFGFNGIYLEITRSGSCLFKSGGSFTDTGFTFTDTSSNNYGLNYSGMTYHYAAFY